MDSISASTVRRITATLFLAQGGALAAYYTGATVSSLTGVAIAGSVLVTGLPVTLTFAGGALAASPAGRLMEHAGRRMGLSIGYLCGVAGGLIAGASALGGSLIGFLVGMLLMGAARAVCDLARYAAADVLPARLRARAVSILVFAGTIGAVVGPILATQAGQVAHSRGLPELAGPWFAGAILFMLAAIFINLFLRPDPRDIARTRQAAAEAEQPAGAQPPARSFRQILSQPAAQLAVVSMALAQTVMINVMVVTPIHMQHYGHQLPDINFVAAAHSVGMFGLSVIVGWLGDRWGKRRVIGLGSLLLIVSCLIAPQDTDTWPLAVSLFLLGLGWNMCFVAGSALLTDRLALHERAPIQGAADRVANGVAAAGSLASGLLLDSLGYPTLALLAAGMALVIAALTLRTQHGRPLEAAATN